MKKRILRAVLLPLIALVVVFANSGIAKADPFARGRWYGYFHNRLDTSGPNLVAGGIYVNNAQAFADFYWWRLFASPSSKDHVVSAFTILTMLGAPAGTPWTVAKDRFGEWHAIVNWYAANGRISWGAMYPYTFNTYYQDAYGDVAWYIEPDTRDSIVFYNPDGSTYAIKKDCANPVGNMSRIYIPPPPPPPPTVVQCGTMTVAPNPVEINQPATVTVRPSFSGGPPTPNVTNAYIRVNGPGVAYNWTVTPNPAPPGGPGGGTITFTSPSFTPPNPGLYTVTWDLRVNGVAPSPSPCGGSSNINFDSFEVMRFPYLEVAGGDVAAGAGIVTTAGQACGINNTRAGVTSWNTNAAPYAGAGGQYATFAWDFIQEFVTSKGSGRAPNYLSFANDGASQTNLATGRYGGFGRPNVCIDHWAKAPATNRQVPNAGGVDLNAVPNDTYMHNGDLTIVASTLDPGKKVTIYVTGNVRITGDIAYANTTWTSFAQIPAFKLVAKGVIHIGSNVGRIDGTYAAIPTTPDYTLTPNSYAAPAAGTISTCSSGFTVLNPAAAPVSMVSSCNRRLEVNGSLSANQIFFLRTFGTRSGGQAAEYINFSPEAWLVPTQSNEIDPAYQSVVGLPPVL